MEEFTKIEAARLGIRSASCLGHALSNQEVIIVVGNNPILIDCFRRGENSILQQSVIR